MTNAADTLSRQLKRRREAAGWSFEEFARRSGLSVTTLSRLERYGLRKRICAPTLDTIEVMAQTLGCSVAELLTENEH